MIYKSFVGVVCLLLVVKGCQLIGPNSEWEDRVRDVESLRSDRAPRSDSMDWSFKKPISEN